MAAKYKMAFVGGGSGGHFYPLIGVAESIQERNTDGNISLHYFGPNSYNPESLARVNMEHIYCPSGKQRRYASIKNFIDIFKVFFGLIVAFFKLLWLYPDVIFSKGGHTSVPVVVAGWLLRIPIVVHESDATPGRANRLAARLARYIAISYDDVAKHFPAGKTALTGIPSRQSFFEPISNDQIQSLGIDPDRPLLFVTGGSQGAERINNLIINSLDELLPHYTILHQTGTTHEALVKQTAIGLIQDSTLLSRYHVRGHMSGEDFATALGVAAVVISRAGSTTIHQIALKAKPSILIPIPEDISHDQRTNAYAYARSGAASVMEEKNLTDNLLVAELTRIMSDQNLYQNMSNAAKSFAHPQAADTIAQALIDISHEHQ